MRLRVNDTENYNLTLDLNVDYANESITVQVGFWNKKKHQTTGWEFQADEFHLALKKYRQLEETYFSNKQEAK